MKFRGYHEDAELPLTRGQSIVVPAGTTVVSTNPRRRRFVTSRRQTVKIHSFGCGRSFCVGHETKDGQRVGSLMSREDGEILHGIYGSRDPAVLVNLADATVRGGTVFLPVDDPTVVWAGTGGYWCEVDINLLLEANGVPDHE